jgi:hypothetical protein
MSKHQNITVGKANVKQNIYITVVEENVKTTKYNCR